jgi:hypothetical protein
MLLLRFIILSLLFLFFIFFYIIYVTSPISQKSLKFGGTSTRRPCASPRTRIPPSQSLGGTLVKYINAMCVAFIQTKGLAQPIITNVDGYFTSSMPTVSQFE